MEISVFRSFGSLLKMFAPKNANDQFIDTENKLTILIRGFDQEIKNQNISIRSILTQFFLYIQSLENMHPCAN